jgi:hypothetical protein
MQPAPVVADMHLRKKRLLHKIEQLGSTEHTEIFKICKMHGVSITETRLNGVFFNLTTLSDDVFFKIEDFVNYCHSNKSELDAYDQRLNECKFYNRRTPVSMCPVVTYGVNEPADIVKKNNLNDLMDIVDRDTTKKMGDFIRKLNIVSSATTSDKGNHADSEQPQSCGRESNGNVNGVTTNKHTNRNSNRFTTLKKKFAKRQSQQFNNVSISDTEILGLDDKCCEVAGTDGGVAHR